MSLKLDHIGHVVENLEEARKLYEDRLGLVPKLIMSHPQFESKMVFYPFADIEMELIQPSRMPEDYAKTVPERTG